MGNKTLMSLHWLRQQEQALLVKVSDNQTSLNSRCLRSITNALSPLNIIYQHVSSHFVLQACFASGKHDDKQRKKNELANWTSQLFLKRFSRVFPNGKSAGSNCANHVTSQLKVNIGKNCTELHRSDLIDFAKLKTSDWLKKYQSGNFEILRNRADLLKGLCMLPTKLNLKWPSDIKSQSAFRKELIF